MVAATLLGPLPLLLAGVVVVLGLTLLSSGARSGGARRAAAVAVGSMLVGAALVEVGARVALERGLAGPAEELHGGDLYADDLQLPAGLRVARHALPTAAPSSAPDRARIVVLGDSFAHGEGVPQADTFAARLGDLVHPADGRPVEVVNLGLSGLDAADEHLLFLAYGQGFAADVVVWVLVPNDLGGGQLWDVDGYDDLVVARSRWEPGPCVACGLVAYGMRARRLEADVVASYRRSFTPAALDGLEGELRDVAEAVHEHGGRLIVATFPLLWRLDALPFADLHAAVLDRARAAGADALDLGPTFAGRDEASLWASPRDHHPNAAGHALAAAALADAVGTDLPHAHAAPCHDGAGAEALAACAAPTRETLLALAAAQERPQPGGGPGRGRLIPFLRGWASLVEDGPVE